MASQPAIALAASNTKLIIPEVDAVQKIHVWKIGDAYYEDLNKAREAMTDKLLADFFEKNKLKTPSDISKALAEYMRVLTKKVEEALK